MISVHPKIVGISPELVFGTIKTLVLAEILRGEEANGRSGDMMAWDEEVELCPVFADECPSNASVSGHGCGTVDCLDFSNGSGEVIDKVATIWCDGEGATSV